MENSRNSIHDKITYTLLLLLLLSSSLTAQVYFHDLSDGFRITWDPVLEPHTGFQITYLTNSASWVMYVPAPATEASIGDLRNHTEYHFYIQTMNDSLISPVSNVRKGILLGWSGQRVTAVRYGDYCISVRADSFRMLDIMFEQHYTGFRLWAARDSLLYSPVVYKCERMP